jgi:phosphohistidine phosphatase
VERPLAPRGERAAAKVADWLRASSLDPQLVLCSPAVRAVQTLDAIRPVLDASATVVFEAALYGASSRALLRRVRQVPGAVDAVLVVGHNPGMHDLAELLAGTGDVALRSQLSVKFPTGALAVLVASVGSWDDLAPGSARLADLVLPRRLPKP